MHHRDAADDQRDGLRAPIVQWRDTTHQMVEAARVTDSAFVNCAMLDDFPGYGVSGIPPREACWINGFNHLARRTSASSGGRSPSWSAWCCRTAGCKEIRAWLNPPPALRRQPDCCL